MIARNITKVKCDNYMIIKVDGIKGATISKKELLYYFILSARNNYTLNGP